MPPQLETKALPFDLKAADGDGSSFEGIASAYNVLDRGCDIIAPGAFTDTLGTYLRDGVIRRDHKCTIGKPTKCQDSPGGLLIAGKISDTADGRDTKTLLKDGVLKFLSIGYVAAAYMYLPSEEAIRDYWRKAGHAPSAEEDARARSEGYARVLTKVHLFEVSVVDVPMNGECDITGVKSLEALRAESKAGRKVSKANLERLAAQAAGLESAAAEMRKFIDEHTPKPAAGDDDESKALETKLLLLALDLGL